jgi:hypothetical protein
MLLDIPLAPIVRQDRSLVPAKDKASPMVAIEALSRPVLVLPITRTSLPIRSIAAFFSPFFQGLWGTLYKWLSINEHLEEVVYTVNAARFFRCARRLSTAGARQ